MQPILVIPKTEQEYSLVMAMLKKMRIKASALANEGIAAMSMDEFYSMIDSSLKDANEGRTISNANLKEKIEEWR